MTNIRQIISKFIPKINMPTTIVSLEKASGYYTAEDIKAKNNFPTHDISAVSGFAIKSENLYQIPTSFKIINYNTNLELGEYNLKNGETAYVMQNQRIPNNADIVIEYHQVVKEGRQIIVNEQFLPGHNVKFTGIDFEQGDIIIKAGEKLDSINILSASIFKFPFVKVYKRLKVGIIFNAKEITSDYDEHLDQNDIINSLSNSFTSTFTDIGCETLNLGKVLPLEAHPNHILEFKNDLNKAWEQIDILISIGGFYKFNENLLWATLSGKEFESESCRINIGGSHKMMIGRCNKVIVIALPADLVISVILGNILLKLIMEQMLDIDLVPQRFAKLNRSLDTIDKQSDYIYARLQGQDKGELIVSPYSVQDTLMISRLKYTDCLIKVDPDTEQIKGSLVEIIRLR